PVGIDQPQADVVRVVAQVVEQRLPVGGHRRSPVKASVRMLSRADELSQADAADVSTMPCVGDQSRAWSDVADRYEREFVDPYQRARRNPLLEHLAAIEGAAKKTVADLGCGIGPLLPRLAEQFRRVVAVDFAPGMLARARARCGGYRNVEFLEGDL